jgi:hypothetical protein
MANDFISFDGDEYQEMMLEMELDEVFAAESDETQTDKVFWKLARPELIVTRLAVRVVCTK